MSKELSVNTILSHYRIVSKIGAGGMGEVYLAQDTKLDRKVALKILPGDVAANRDRMNRFVREAKSAAALNHPNIAHIYEIGESDGTHFIAMEFIDGKTLRKKTQEERVPLSKFLKYLNQVAEGLSKAHAAGIVHRDLKPENIMITRDDYAKVLDFGLAKLIEPQRSFGSGDRGSSEIATAIMEHSTPGVVMGTVGYMSPEQASGRVNEIDHRSDIFSFGCILFEAATGQRPFEGKDALDSLHKIVHAPTPQLKDTNPLAPEELQRIVRRCLAKEPEKRYQSIKEVAIELDDLRQELKSQTASDYSGHAKSSKSVTTSGAARADEGFRVAVLPFKARDADPAVATLADGLSEEIVTGLSRFRYLSVVTSTSSVRLKDETEDAPRPKLGTRYVLEGSIRKGGSLIRVSAQLVDTETGAQLWSETYNQDLQTSTVFAVQDDVAGRIVATVADSYGVLVHSMRAAIREQITPSNHAALKRRIERVAERGDQPSDLWACLAQIYVDEYAFGFPGDDGKSLDRALIAARRGVELDRANQFAMVALAQTHFFRQDLAAFGPAAERAMALNPLNTDALGILGLEIVHTADFERGTAIVRRAMELNPNHAGWMHFAPLWDHFHKGEYEQALECANRVDVPGLFWPFLVMASACGHLGRRSEAKAAIRDLLALDPEFAAHARSNVGTWHFASGLMDPILEGLRKAGLEISEATSVATTEPRNSIAVLPFTNLSANPENEYFCDGLAEELLNALAKIDQLKVAARTSTFSFKGKNAPVSEIAKALNVNTIMEGSVRKSGNRVRITAQVINAADGYHLWSERYDREMKDIFDVQDEITLAVVEALKVKLFGQEQAAVLKRHTRNPEAHEFYLRGLSYFMRWTLEFFQKAIESFDQAIAIDPRYALAYAGLSEVYAEMSFFSFQREYMPKAREAARKALELDDTLGNAHNSLAVIKMYYDRDYAGAEHEFKRAIALDPGSAHIHNWYGWYLGLMGRFDESLKEMKRAQELDPLSDLIDFGVGSILHWSRKTEHAIEHFQRVLDLNPNFRIVYWFLADAYVEKGDFASAIATIENAPIALNDPVTLSAAAHAYGKAGERRKALEILSELESQSSQEYESAFHIAQIYLGLGDYEQALTSLEKAYDERSVWLIWLGVDPKFDPLRSNPRFQELLKKVGFAQ